MCSRYELRSPPHNIIERFGLTIAASDFPLNFGKSEVRPTDPALVVSFDKHIDILPWGFQVDWQKSPVINARAETASGKPTFQPFLDRRVIVPASAYYEWRKDGQEKIKTRLSPQGSDIFGMAGLRSDDRFVILTCAPSDSIAHIHTRMPVILNQEGEREWLNLDRSFDELAPFLTPYCAGFDTTEQPRPMPAQADLFG